MIYLQNLMFQSGLDLNVESQTGGFFADCLYEFAHALVCFMALVLYRVMRMRLTAAKRSESPATLRG